MLTEINIQLIITQARVLNIFFKTYCHRLGEKSKNIPSSHQPQGITSVHSMIKIFALPLRSHFQPEQLINAVEPQLKFPL